MSEQGRVIIHSPQEISQLAVLEVEERIKNKGWLNFGLPSIDQFFIPGRPGDLITVIGRPSNYKTGLMQWLGRRAVGQIVAAGDPQACVIYCTWEQAVEEVALHEIASISGLPVDKMVRGEIADIRQVQIAAGRRALQPLYVLGHSVARRKRRPNLTFDTIESAIYEMESGNILDRPIKPALIILDYLQRIRPSRDEARLQDRMRFVNYVDRAKDLALAAGCPVLLGCQAKREVDDRDVKVPRLSDGAETANVEHSSDKVLTVMMPKTYYYEGQVVRLGELEFASSDEVLIVSLAKQKNGPAGKTWLLEVDPAHNDIKSVMATL